MTHDSASYLYANDTDNKENSIQVKFQIEQEARSTQGSTITNSVVHTGQKSARKRKTEKTSITCRKLEDYNKLTAIG